MNDLLKDSVQIPKRNINLRIYKSFDEATAAEALDEAAKPPMQGLKETVDLILRVYGVTREQLRTERNNRMITIIRRQ